MSSAPERSLTQRMDALQRANHIRSRRAVLKQMVRARELDVRPLIAAPESELETMKVWDLLLAVPQYGRVKTNKALRAVSVSPSKTLGGLSERQRRELLSFLE